jgi:hypothetical protein
MKAKQILFMFIAFAFISSCSLKHNDSIDIKYITDPCLIPTKDNKFKLCDNMIIRAHDKFHAVPMGFKTDLASIPRIMWPIFSPGEYDSIAPAVLHDWHYCCVASVSRKLADDIFYYGLRVHGMGRVQAFIYWLGVRAIGWNYYKHGNGLKDHAGEFPEDELQGVYIDVNYGLD